MPISLLLYAYGLTSPTLSPRGRCLSKQGLCFFYFLAWCVWWPLSYEDMYLFLTWWAWYIGAVCE